MDSLMDKQPGKGRRARRLPTRLPTGLTTDSPAFAHMPTGSGSRRFFITSTLDRSPYGADHSCAAFGLAQNPPSGVLDSPLTQIEKETLGEPSLA